jgi:hypothetical protein
MSLWGAEAHRDWVLRYGDRDGVAQQVIRLAQGNGDAITALKDSAVSASPYYWQLSVYAAGGVRDLLRVVDRSRDEDAKIAALRVLLELTYTGGAPPAC